MNAANASALRTQDNGYAAAGARLRALGARTGADTSGAVATLEGNHVASAFPIQQSMAARRQAEIERFKRGALTTAGHLAGQGAGIEAQGLQGGQAMDAHLFNTAGQLASADEARKQATYQRIMAFAQQAGQIAGGASGGGGRSAPQEPTSTGDFAASGQAQNAQNLQRLRSPMGDPEYFDPNGQSDGYDYTYYPGRY